MQKIRITLPALLILSTFILAAPTSALAIEVAPRITDREIVERLTRLEEGQKFIIKHFEQRFEDVARRFEDVDRRFDNMNQRFDDMNQRFDDMNQRFDDMNQRFDDVNQRITEQHQTTLALYGSLIALIIALFGYISWDRRTMFRPIKERLEQIEQELRIEPDTPTRPYSPRSKASSDAGPPDAAAHGAARA